MSDDNMIRARRNADGTTHPPEGKSDWARVDAMTEEEAYQNALDDPDNPPLTPDRLAKMRRIPNPKKIRTALNLTQQEFACQFHIALGTLRDWEQHVRMPDSTAIAYLNVIEKNPEAVREALNAESLERTIG